MASWLEVSLQDYRSVVFRYEIIYLKERKGRSQAKEICLQKTSLSYSKGPFTTTYHMLKYVTSGCCKDCNRDCEPKKCKVDDHRTQNLNIYCRTCQVLTCTLCKCFGVHKKCHVIPLRLFFKVTDLTFRWPRVQAVIWKTLLARRIKKIFTASKLFWRNFELLWKDILLLLTSTMNLFREMAIRKWLIDYSQSLLELSRRLWHPT